MGCNNWGGGGCWWIIILIIILFSCCGNSWGTWGGNSCGCNNNWNRSNDCGC